MNRIKQFIEWNAFGVCSKIGDKIGIPTTTIRKYFIYTSIFTFGSPILFYFVAAFWLNIKRYVFRSERNPLLN